MGQHLVCAARENVPCRRLSSRGVALPRPGERGPGERQRNAEAQRVDCVRIVHWCRNIFSHVPREKVREVAAMLKAIHAQEDRAAAEAKARDVVVKLRAAKLRKAAELVEQGVDGTLSYHGFPEPHWRRIRTNNPLERIIREIRRRTRVVGAFPDGESALNLAAARLRHIAGTHWSTRRYLDLQPLHDAKIATA